MAKQKLTVELGVDNSQFNKGLNDANTKVKTFGSGISKIGALLRGAAFAGAITAAFGAAIKVIKTTQEGGDKLAAAMKGVAGAGLAAAQSLASADFSVSLRDAYKAAKELEQVYDDLADRQRSLNVLSSENTLEVARLQGILRNSTKTEQERAAAAQQIKDIYAEEGRLREQAVSGAIQGEINALMTKYRISQQEAQAVLDYATNYAKYTSEQHTALNEAMTAERKLDTYLANNELTRDKTVNSLKEAAAVASGQVNPEMQKWIDLWRPINDYSDEHRDQMAKLVVDYNNILNTRQRELNMADRINDRMDAQIDKARDYMNLIGGNKTPALKGGAKQSGLLGYFNIDPLKLSETKGAETNGDPFLDRVTAQMQEQMAIANEMTGVFANMFSVMDEGWKAMADVLIQSIKRIAAEILAKAAVWAIMSVIFPGSSIATKGLLNFIGMGGGGLGASAVAGNASGVGSMQLNVVGRLSGNDILLSGSRAGNKLNSGT